MPGNYVWGSAEEYIYFAMGEDGYPVPGLVLKHWRDSQRWTRQHVGQLVGLSAVMIGVMEHQQSGWDSIARRRLFVTRLDIPPYLLGLDPVHGSIATPPGWWINEGYYPFVAAEGNDCGYPNPGKVVKYYRERIIHTRTGKPWTQSDLGEVLSVSDVMVRNMENHNHSLDSITRRRFLARLLEIPPVLLGLDSLHILTQEQSETIAVTKSSRTVGLETMTLEQYRIFLSLFWELSFTSQAQDKLGDIFQLMKQLKARCFQGDERQRRQSKELLFHYHQFVAVVTNDQRQYHTVLYHLNQAMQLAQELQDQQLTEVALLRRGWAYIELKDYSRAIADLERASRCTIPKLRGLILLGSSHAHAQVVQDGTDRLAVMHRLDEAASIVRRGIFEHDEHFLDLAPDVYHIDRAGALLILQRPCDASEALESIELAARDVSPDRTRRHARLNIYKANIYAQQGDYPHATVLALSALPVMKAVKSTINIERIGQLYEQLHSSSYGDSTDVAQLGRELLIKG